MTALHVTDDLDDAAELQAVEGVGHRRAAGDPGVEVPRADRAAAALPGRGRQAEPVAPITVVLAEYVPHRWWEWPLHNQTALRLKGTLFFRPNTAVIDLPYHLLR